VKHNTSGDVRVRDDIVKIIDIKSKFIATIKASSRMAASAIMLTLMQPCEMV
jgi:hypothetical protein